ncbi:MULTISPECIES: hypothetical protein [Paenibacillus]|uniref:Uncharacterized protein n=1 Tax=Paenibacillus peoriae TaxID=59893 RepID=A0ABU1QIU8_9BACL|nr:MULTISPECIES: hypothetical protein [Paenibacillus]MDR6779352.1 hypothetical protein [Paenibacillus peoriae]
MKLNIICPCCNEEINVVLNKTRHTKSDSLSPSVEQLLKELSIEFG